MKPRTISLLLRVCLLCAVLALPLMFFNMILGASILIIATAVLLLTAWKAWKLARTAPDSIRALSKSERELSIKDLPTRLVILLVAVLVIAVLAEFGAFAFNPLIDVMVTVLIVLLAVYYFLQKRRLLKWHSKTVRLISMDRVHLNGPISHSYWKRDGNPIKIIPSS